MAKQMNQTQIDTTCDASYQTIVARLKKLGIQWKLVMLVSGILTWIAYLALILGVELMLDSLLTLPRILRMAMVVIWIGCAVWFGYMYIFKRIRRDTSQERVAAYIERSYPGMENRLISSIQLWPEIDKSKYGYSVSFIEKLVQQAYNSLSGVESKRVLATDLQNLKKSGLIILGSMVILTAFLFIFPGSIGNFVQAFTAIPKTPVEILTVRISDVTPGNYTIRRGEDVQISAKVTGLIGATAHLYYRNEDGTWRTTEMSSPENGSRKEEVGNRNAFEYIYGATLKNVRQSLEYHIVAKSVKSPTYTITVIKEPIINYFQLKLNYPKYTNLSPQELEQNAGNVTALIGTEVRFTGESNKPLASAVLVMETAGRQSQITPAEKAGKRESGKASKRYSSAEIGNKSEIRNPKSEIRLSISEGVKLTGSFIVQRSGKYHILLTDTNGTTNSEPIQYVINALKDEEPRVEIISPGQDTVLDDSMLIPLEISALDDYGVKKARLVYRIEGQEAEHAITLKVWDEPLESAMLSYTWDAEPLGMFPEDVVSYRAEALDADNVSGPNVGQSQTYTARFPSLMELYEQVESEQLTQQQGMDDLLEKQEEAADIVEDIIDQLRKSQELTWKEQKDLEQVEQMQEQIEQAAQELVKEMEQTARDIKKDQLLDMETMQKYQELRQLMEQALSQEHKEILKKLAEALEKQRLSEQEKDLLAAKFNQDAFKQRLEQMIELYKKLLMQQKLEEAANVAKELAERQEKLMEKAKELAEAMEKGRPRKVTKEADKSAQQKSQDMAKQESRVGENLEDLQGDLDSLAQEMQQEQNYAQIGKEVARLNQEARDNQLAQQLQSAGEQFRQSQPRQAIKQGNQALSGLQNLQQGLDNALEFMRGQNADAALAAIQKAVREGLYVSQSHEQLMQTTNKMVTKESRYIRSERKSLHALASKELDIAEATRMLAGSLWDLGQEQMMIDPKIVWTLNSAQDAITRAARALEDQKPNLAIPIQRQALGDVNQAVAELLKALDQMNMQMSMSCLDSMLEQLQQLAESQGKLNEMAEKLSEQMRQQGRVPGMEEMMKRMAFEQSLIRDATERLAERMEKLAQALGNLKDIAKDMREVEGELTKGNLDQQVLDKQRKILTRMLESAKSLQKRQMSKRRKGETAKDTAYSEAPASINPELLKTLKQMEAELQSSDAENWPEQYRELVRLYYKALSEKAGGINR